MNAKKAKAVAYVVVSVPVILVTAVIIKTALFTAGFLCDFIAQPLIKSRRNIMLDGMRLIDEAAESEG